MKRLQTLRLVLAILVVFSLLLACAGPQPPAVSSPDAGGETTSDEATSETDDAAEEDAGGGAEEVIEFELSGETPPLAAEAEGIEYTDVPELAYEGEITMYAQAYTPIEP